MTIPTTTSARRTGTSGLLPRLRSAVIGSPAPVRILIAGDSHSKPFEILPTILRHRPELTAFKIDVDVVPGATIAGLGRRTSHLKLRERLGEKIESFRPDVVGINLGQVDIELGFYHKRIAQGRELDFDAFVQEIVASFEAFLEQLKLSYAGTLFVKGVNIPVLCYNRRRAVVYTSRIIFETIDDEQERLRLVARLMADLPGDHERTSYHRRFNENLQAACARHGVLYYDINDKITDPATGLVDMKFIPGGPDHHVADSLETRLLYWDELLERLPAVAGSAAATTGGREPVPVA